MAYSQVQKMETKIQMEASDEQFYDVFCNRPHHIANITPETVQSVQIHKGEWGSEVHHFLELHNWYGNFHL